MAHESGFLGKIAKKLLPRQVVLIKQDPKKDVGWWTGQNEKIEYCTKIAQRLQNGRLWYARNLVCPAPWVTDSDRAKIVRQTMRKFEGQIARLKFVEEETVSALGHAKKGVSGASDKRGKRARGFVDDLAIVFGMGLYIFHRVRCKDIQGLPYAELHL